jgi:recombination protein RecA
VTTKKKKTDIHNIVEVINKKLKTNISIGDADSLAVKRIETGIPPFDQILGGGIPRQSVTEFYGYQSSGKTYIAQRIIAHAQSQGLQCGFVDAEWAFEPTWAANIGIDTEQLIVSRPHTGESALDILLALCEAGLDLVVLDSIAALLPTAEAEGSMEDQQMGLHARLMNKIFRKLPMAMAATNPGTAVVMINQIRAGLGGYITKEALPGGKGQEFFSRIMVRMSKSESIGDKGFYIKMRTPKNKTFQPLKECSVPFYYDGQQNPTYELFTTALDLEIIERRGATYTFNGIKAIGKDNFVSSMKGDQNLYDDIQKMVRSKV